MSEQQEPPIGWSEALGEHANNPEKERTTGETIYALGKEWTVSPVENRIKAQFEQWVRKRARRAIADAEMSDPEEANALRSVYMSDYANHKYSWDDTADGEMVRNARASTNGAIYLMYLLLRRCHKDMTEKLSREIAEANPRDWLFSYRWAMGLVGNSQPPENSNNSRNDEPKKEIASNSLTPAEMQMVEKWREEQKTTTKTMPQTMDG